MKVDKRRKEIAAYLMSTDKAVPGAALGELFGVSRQIIVHDISALKEAGYDIDATHSGYVIRTSPLAERVFKVKHTSDQTEDELGCIVDLGGNVVDVHVWHKVYGKLCAKLGIINRQQVKQFIEGVRSGKSVELMSVTGGYHYHTVKAESEEILDKIYATLNERGYIVPEI